MTAADCTATWSGTAPNTTGDFASLAGWTPAPPAANSGVACISGGAIVQASGNLTLRGVVLSGGGSLVVDGGSLTLTEPSVLSGGDLVVAGATLSVPAGTASGGTSRLVLAGDEGIAAQITGTFSVGAIDTPGGNVNLGDPSPTATATAAVTVNAPATLTAGYLQMQDGSTLAVAGDLAIPGLHIRLFDTSKISSGGNISLTGGTAVGGWVQAHGTATGAALAAGPTGAVTVVGAFGPAGEDLRVGIYGPLAVTPALNVTGGGTASFGPLRVGPPPVAPTIGALRLDPTPANRERDGLLETIVFGTGTDNRLPADSVNVASAVLNGTVRILTDPAYAAAPKVGDVFEILNSTAPITGTPRFETRAFTLTPESEFAYTAADTTLRIRNPDGSPTLFGYEPAVTANKVTLKVVDLPLPPPGAADPGASGPVLIVGGPTTGAGSEELAPVRDRGARSLAAKRLKSGSVRVTLKYKLAQACATTCKAKVQLRFRNGKILFATALPRGTGRLLATSTVTLKSQKTKTVQITVAKKALRGIAFKKLGKNFRVLPVRLIVSLPQADGRTLMTVRDGTLKLRVN